MYLYLYLYFCYVIFIKKLINKKIKKTFKMLSKRKYKKKEIYESKRGQKERLNNIRSERIMLKGDIEKKKNIQIEESSKEYDKNIEHTIIEEIQEESSKYDNKNVALSHTQAIFDESSENEIEKNKIKYKTPFLHSLEIQKKHSSIGIQQSNFHAVNLTLPSLQKEEYKKKKILKKKINLESDMDIENNSDSDYSIDNKEIRHGNFYFHYKISFYLGSRIIDIDLLLDFLKIFSQHSINCAKTPYFDEEYQSGNLLN